MSNMAASHKGDMFCMYTLLTLDKLLPFGKYVDIVAASSFCVLPSCCVDHFPVCFLRMGVSLS